MSVSLSYTLGSKKITNLDDENAGKSEKEIRETQHQLLVNTTSTFSECWTGLLFGVLSVRRLNIETSQFNSFFEFSLCYQVLFYFMSTISNYGRLMGLWFCRYIVTSILFSLCLLMEDIINWASIWSRYHNLQTEGHGSFSGNAHEDRKVKIESYHLGFVSVTNVSWDC